MGICLQASTRLALGLGTVPSGDSAAPRKRFLEKQVRRTRSEVSFRGVNSAQEDGNPAHSLADRLLFPLATCR